MEADMEVFLRPVRVEFIDLTGRGGKRSGHDFLTENACIVSSCIRGGIDLLITAEKKTKRHTIPAGRMSSYSCYCKGCRISCSCDQPSQMLQVVFPFATLFSLLEKNKFSAHFPETGNDQEKSSMVRDITPPMYRIIGIIKDALPQDHEPDLFVLAKAFELLWLYVNSLPLNQGPRINQYDRRAVQEALHILEMNLEAPPRLVELASRAGMSASKFKKLFPRVCGIPPYEYLRKKRMEKAMYLLVQGNMSVTEVAMEVGYSSLSHFAKAFFKEFDITPSRVRSQAPQESK
jgi:AraC-like DNA-binding protein